MNNKYPRIKNKKEIIDYILSLSPDKNIKNLVEKLKSKYTLEKILLRKLGKEDVKYSFVRDGFYINIKKAGKYAKLDTSIPPIVVNLSRFLWLKDYDTMDGYHRIEAARIKKDEYILAYVGRGKTSQNSL